MKKSEALGLFRNLNQLGALTGVRFAYAITKNLNLLKGEIESLEKALEATDKFTEFETARIALVEKHADKDEDDKPKTETDANGGQKYIMSDSKLFDKEFETLKKTHKETVEAREKQITDYTALLDTESDFKPYMLKLADVPEAISTSQMAGIVTIIED